MTLPNNPPMWDDEEETTPDSYLNPSQLEQFVTFNLDTKTSRENFQTVSPNATTLQGQGLMRVNLTDLEDKESVKKQMKDGFHDLIGTYLTSEFMDGRTFEPSEVAQAFRDALMDEAQWHQKMATRCEQFRKAVSQIPAPPRE